jgi:hypothetical protein
LGGRLSIFLAVGGTIVAALLVVSTADPQAICNLRQLSIDQSKDFDVTRVVGTSEVLSAASRYIGATHGLSEKNDAPNFLNMLLEYGA